MSSRLKITSAAFLVLTGVFVFAKFHLTRLRVPPFGLDPCDAVMHFAFFTILFALLGSLRAMRPYREGITYPTQRTYVLRSLQAVALAAMVAFVAHAVDLARHPGMWVSAAWRNQLLGWFGVFAAVPVAMELLVFLAQPTQTEAERPSRKRAILACLLALTTLVFCPEYPINIDSETSHILTVIVGGLVVLVPIGYLLPVLAPNQSGEQRGDKAFFNTSSERSALLIGILMGTVLFGIDAHRTGTMLSLLPVLKLVGPIMGLLIVYAFLAERLGWTSHQRVNRDKAETGSAGSPLDC
jgi:hypothetical protein